MKSFDAVSKYIRPSKPTPDDAPTLRHNFKPVRHRYLKAFGALIFSAGVTIFGDYTYFLMGDEGNSFGWIWDDDATNSLTLSAMSALGWLYVVATVLIFVAFLASIGEGVMFMRMKGLPRGLYPRWFVPTVLFGYTLRFYCNIIESFFYAQNEDMYALFDNWTKNSLLIDWQSCINKTLSIAPVTGMMLRLAALYYGYPSIQNWRPVWRQPVQMTRPSWWIQHLALIYTAIVFIPVLIITIITESIYLSADPDAPEDPTPRSLSLAIFHINFITGGIDLFLAFCILIVRRELQANDLDRSKLLVTISFIYNFSNYWGMYATRTYIGRWDWVPFLQFCVLSVQVSLVIAFWMRNTSFIMKRRRQLRQPPGLEVSSNTGFSNTGQKDGSDGGRAQHTNGENEKSKKDGAGVSVITGEINIEEVDRPSHDDFSNRV